MKRYFVRFFVYPLGTNFIPSLVPLGESHPTSWVNVSMVTDNHAKALVVEWIIDHFSEIPIDFITGSPDLSDETKHARVATVTTDTTGLATAYDGCGKHYVEVRIQS